MDINTPRKRKASRKPIYILLIFLFIFGLFVYLITRPSQQSLAITELQSCYSVEEIKSCWNKYKQDLHEDKDFLFEVRTKLSGLNLPDSKLKECKEWLPPPQESLNLIVVPDLSRRIVDSLNNPNQIENDIKDLQSIWSAFKSYSRLRHDTKDRLIIDLTDVNQANGKFSDLANNLQFDLSTHKGKSNKLYFTNEKDIQFDSSIRKTYKLAVKNPVGADYHLYLKQYLKGHLKKSTLFDNYLNKVIIITDGYIEPENRQPYTRIHEPTVLRKLQKSVDDDNVLETINSNALNIRHVKIDLTETEFLICEVTARKGYENYDFVILNEYWKDWFKRMKVKNADEDFFFEHQKASDLTANKIREFILSGTKQ